jgi:hypothetical protein
MQTLRVHESTHEALQGLVTVSDSCEARTPRAGGVLSESVLLHHRGRTVTVTERSGIAVEAFGQVHTMQAADAFHELTGRRGDWIHTGVGGSVGEVGGRGGKGGAGTEKKWIHTSRDVLGRRQMTCQNNRTRLPQSRPRRNRLQRLAGCTGRHGNPRRADPQRRCHHDARPPRAGHAAAFPLPQRSTSHETDSPSSNLGRGRSGIG